MRVAGLTRFAIVLAAISAIAGVLVYAAAAHTAGPGSQQRFALSSSAVMLLVNAAIALGLTNLGAQLKLAWRWSAAAVLVLFGTVLFALSVVVPNITDYYGVTLFANAGPIGAYIIIAGLLAAAINAVVAKSVD